MSDTPGGTSSLPAILLSQIRSRVRMLQRSSLERAWLAVEPGDWPRPLERVNEPKDRPWDLELAALAYELDAVLPDLPIDDETLREFKSGDWSIGSQFQVLAPLKILRGFVLPIRQVPIRVPVSLKVFAFITIDDDSFLDRHLFQGIHYHYCLADKRHTTTMVCWDTRWTPDPVRPKDVRAIFHELHAEGAKSVRARPERWNDEKRKSIREACASDLKRYRIEEFRCASDDSSPVWPKTAKLTPRSLPSLKTTSRRKRK
ncbi:hypothetical protein [Rhizobium johnstonii]|uniref:hypothetical protein n=1 Tax=Rhizobium johnstonii TaxID=3019933 RepID=UPI003F97B103